MRPDQSKALLSRLAVLSACCLILAGCVTTQLRNPYTVEELITSSVSERNDLRFFPARESDVQAALDWSGEQGNVPPPAEGGRFDVLALSAGGPDGAFGAGALSGMQKAGNRPQYEVVTGASTGAVIAPFAFLGPRYDNFITSMYRDNVLGKLLGRPNYLAAISGPSLYSGKAIFDFLDEQVTPQLLAEIATEHAKGRRLLITTANLDANQLTVWDMGRIASIGTPQARQLFRSIMRASFSIPGALPPVEIKGQSGGKQFTELHGDAGLLAYFYADPALVPPAYRKRGGQASRPRIDIILHNQIEAKPEPVEAKTLTLAGKSISNLTRTSMRLLLDESIRNAADNKIALRYTYLPIEWRTVSSVDFEAEYLRDTWQLGYQRALNGTLWHEGPRKPAGPAG